MAHPLHIATPLLPSATLSTACGRQVQLKMEALQPPGSFKIRGIGLACQTHAQAGKRRFVSSSGGNAGLAVAYAGQCLHIPVTVVVPQTTSSHAQALLKQYGADVIVHGSTWNEANALAQTLLGPQDAFIHPFDDPLLWAGHASMVDEVITTGFTPDAVVTAVGGGGLLCGVAQGLAQHDLGHVPIIAAETAGAASLALAMQTGAPAALDAITSIATSLGAKQVCARAFALSQQRPIISHVVKDADAVSACLRFLDEHRILVEPACGAALAAVYAGADLLAPFKQVLLIVCGGATCSLAQLQGWHATL